MILIIHLNIYPDLGRWVKSIKYNENETFLVK